jgi:hypothetical protein
MRKAVMKDFPTRVTFSASGANDAGTSGWQLPKDFGYICVQNRSDSGTVSCAITSNGRVIKSNSSSGACVIATGSGTAYEHRPRQQREPRQAQTAEEGESPHPSHHRTVPG